MAGGGRRWRAHALPPGACAEVRELCFAGWFTTLRAMVCVAITLCCRSSVVEHPLGKAMNTRFFNDLLGGVVELDGAITDSFLASRIDKIGF